MFAWQKICVEFQKRVDPDLPLYYYTCSHDCYYEDVMPDKATKTQEAGMFTYQGIDCGPFSYPYCER